MTVRRQISSFLAIVFLLSTITCTAATKFLTTNGLNKPNTVGGVSISITSCAISAVKGDRTVSNVRKSNGNYFALGSKIVKAADYNLIKLTLKINNESAQTYNYSQKALSVLPRGIVLGNNIDQIDKVAVKTSKIVTMNYYKKKAIQANKLSIIYNFLNYDVTFYSDLKAIAKKKMTVSQFEKKYEPTALYYSVPISK